MSVLIEKEAAGDQRAGLSVYRKLVGDITKSPDSPENS